LAAAAGRVVLAGLFVVGLLASAAGPAAPVGAQTSTVSYSTAEAAPADAVAYLVATLDDQSDQWRLADALLDRAGVGEAIEEAMAEELSDESGEDLPLDAFLGGEIGLVVTDVAVETLAEESTGGMDFDAMLTEMGLATPTAAPEEPEAQGFGAILDARAPDTAWAGIRQSIQEDAHEEVMYEGTTILYAPATDPEEDGTAAARAGNLILIATTPEDLHPLIDTVDGRTPAISTVPEFSNARDALPKEFLVFAFINSLAAQSADFGPFEPAMSTVSTEAYTGMTIAADEPGFRMESVAFPAPGESFPPAAANFESELARLAPADTVFFSSAADLGATGVLDALGAAALSIAFGMAGPMGMEDPSATPGSDDSPEEAIAAQYEAAAGLIGINLQTDLFQQLAGEYGGWLAADPEAQSVSGVFASRTADADVVANTMRQISFLIQGAAGAEAPVTTRDVGGGEIYVIGLGDEAGSTFEFGVIGDQLVIGKGDAVDRFGGAADALADDAQYQAVLDTLPVEHNGLVYINLERAIPLLQVAAEESEGLDLGGMGEFPDASESCANYGNQEEAQAAYDAAETGTFDLDQDFDGEACEDYFMTAATAKEPATDAMLDEDVTEAFADVDYSGLRAFASVAYDQDGLRRSSSILSIAE
jgi:hypothetical protein